METKKFYILYLLVACTGLFLNSCTKEETPEGKNYQYLVSGSYKFGITSQEIKTKFSAYQVLIPEVAAIGAVVQSNVAVEKITYKTSFKGTNIQASGLVCLPKKAGNFPVLCFQNGTNTLNSDAPSENPTSSTYSILECVASMGFIVVMPDYIGFGESSGIAHPYLHAESTTQSILDMLRAVNEFGSEDSIVAKPTKDLYIFGYSQGGWATLALQKAIETNYSTEFNLKASSCGAGPYSIEYMNDYIAKQTTYPMPYFLAYLMNAYTSNSLVTNPISDYIKAPYAAKVAGLFDGKHSGSTINAALTTKVADLLTDEFRTEYSTNAKFATTRTAFSANSVAAWQTTTPTRLYHGANDEYIPLALSQKTLADFKAKGVADSKIQLVIVPGVDHSLGVIPVGFQTIIWFLTLKGL